MRAKPFFLLAALPLFGSAAALAVSACSSVASSVGIEPITGIQIRADRLLAGKGCGRGTTQALKYAAVVKDAAGNARAGGVYDCFADALFQDLTPSEGDASTNDYFIDVYVFNAAAYEANGNAGSIGSAVGEANRGVVPAPEAFPATWATTCVATQRLNIEVVAFCEPLLGTEATSTLRLTTASFDATAADGAPLPMTCGADFNAVRASVRGLPPPSELDAGADASDASTSSEGDAGATDGGSDSGLEDEDASAPPTPPAPPPPSGLTVTCPTPIEFQVPTPADHVLDVELLGSGNVVARTTCYATATPRIEAIAVCDPIRRE